MIYLGSWFHSKVMWIHCSGSEAELSGQWKRAAETARLMASWKDKERVGGEECGREGRERPITSPNSPTIWGSNLQHLKLWGMFCVQIVKLSVGIFKSYLFYVYGICLHVNLCTTRMSCLQRPEKAVGSPKSGVIGGCDLLDAGNQKPGSECS